MICKDHLNTAYQWGVIVGQPNLDKWKGPAPTSIHYQQVGLWVLVHPDGAYRVLDGKQIMAFNSEEKAKQFAASISGVWNYEAKKIPNKKK
jgi:hypothetical protein